MAATGVEYGYVLREGRDAIILEKKEDMKKRGLASPDLADALALTFAYPVAAQGSSLAAHRQATLPIAVRPVPTGLVGATVMGTLTQSLDARTHATAQNPL